MVAAKNPVVCQFSFVSCCDLASATQENLSNVFEKIREMKILFSRNIEVRTAPSQQSEECAKILAQKLKLESVTTDPQIVEKREGEKEVDVKRRMSSYVKWLTESYLIKKKKFWYIVVTHQDIIQEIVDEFYNKEKEKEKIEFKKDEILTLVVRKTSYPPGYSVEASHRGEISHGFILGEVLIGGI